MRKEIFFEILRLKVIYESMDKWFIDYRVFLFKRDLFDKGYRIWNIDEIGFIMGSKLGKVIGFVKLVVLVDCLYVLGGLLKERLIVFYLVNVEGFMMFFFFVYLELKLRLYNFMKGV